MTFNGNLSYGRTRNLYTNNPQNSFNADATLNWNPVKFRKLHTMVDFHQQNTLNAFAPAFFTLFGDPSLHRFWSGLGSSNIAPAKCKSLAHTQTEPDAQKGESGKWFAQFGQQSAKLGNRQTARSST